MENGPFIDGLPINSMVISMAMLVITRWYIPKVKIPQFGRWMVQCENKHRPTKGMCMLNTVQELGTCVVLHCMVWAIWVSCYRKADGQQL